MRILKGKQASKQAMGNEQIKVYREEISGNEDVMELEKKKKVNEVVDAFEERLNFEGWGRIFEIVEEILPDYWEAKFSRREIILEEEVKETLGFIIMAAFTNAWVDDKIRGWHFEEANK